MGETKGFMKYDRQEAPKEPVSERVRHWREFHGLLPEAGLKEQGARCMDCGVPFCQDGCPIGNIIPDWNDLVYRGRWEEAIERLHRTNNFPEFTGRVCPAPCEDACVLAINAPAVTIKAIELAIIEHAYAEGWLRPHPPSRRRREKVAVVGSGPAGLACADELNQFGYRVTVFEKNEIPGGLLVLGIPDYKLEKGVVHRRLERMRQEGVVFRTGVTVGKDLPAADLIRRFDGVVLCGGAEKARDLAVPGRELAGIHPAMAFLTQQNRVNQGLPIPPEERITAAGKDVVILGGGDTGADCAGTALRQGARSVTQVELMPRPPRERTPDNPWPAWARIERTSSSHEEGVVREYSVLTKGFEGRDGRVTGLAAVRLAFGEPDLRTGRPSMTEIAGSAFVLPASLVLLAMGFLGPETRGLLDDLGVALDGRGNVRHDPHKMTSLPGVFAAGDMARGQSLVVWAIQEGRAAARGVHRYLSGAAAGPVMACDPDPGR